MCEAKRRSQQRYDDQPWGRGDAEDVGDADFAEAVKDVLDDG